MEKSEGGREKCSTSCIFQWAVVLESGKPQRGQGNELVELNALSKERRTVVSCSSKDLSFLSTPLYNKIYFLVLDRRRFYLNCANLAVAVQQIDQWFSDLCIFCLRKNSLIYLQIFWFNLVWSEAQWILFFKKLSKWKSSQVAKHTCHTILAGQNKNRRTTTKRRRGKYRFHPLPGSTKHI